MTIYRATVMDTPVDPFGGGALRAESDIAIAVADGRITARGSFAEVRAAAPDDEVLDLRDGVLLPGFVDTHVHFPQVRAIGALGMPLLDWLEHSALPEEAKLHDPAYAQAIATEFLHGLTRAGTTSALVFGSHFASAVDVLFTQAEQLGLRITSGLVVSDRLLREDLLTTPERAYDESVALASRWQGHERIRYAVTPRFSYSCSSDLLEACGAAYKDIDNAWCTSHVNENVTEVAEVTRLFGGTSYVGTYQDHGLLGAHTILAHNVHPTDAELDMLSASRAAVAHCPTSNASLGSGMFPLAAHLQRGVRVAMGTDVGGGTGFSMFKEGLQAYFIQSLLGAQGMSLTPAHLLHLATTAGADALGLREQVGELSVGKQFDAVFVAPEADSPLGVGIWHASSADDALAKIFALGTPADIARVWVDGRQIKHDTW
ncbi:guanine deaminase [Flexivirga oryzae]|uniref:Guanine deaminase n=1 Tax=Flexivirga oryzae TaxID=1794944 RepID=A0A839N4P3_9MICO|nr:guanine deaminase [Flexivirga oryzae]MBB2892277.1 guanine deaminase [Flexivirga oryzae]